MNLDVTAETTIGDCHDLVARQVIERALPRNDPLSLAPVSNERSPSANLNAPVAAAVAVAGASDD